MTALSCRAFNTIVKENDLVKKAFEGHGFSFPFVGYRYVEDQTVYPFHRSAIVNGLRPNEEPVRGVLTIRKRIGDDGLRLDVQVAGENVHPATERNISICNGWFRRIGAFKTTRINIFDSIRLGIVIFGHSLRIRVFNGKYRASYLLFSPSVSPSGDSLREYSLSIARGCKALFS